ncbi:MAG: hypothetical protein IIU07_00380 [Lachnospiraceae bacterium]|nr:hypothetical protein [Lachnospiraceae bacterium]
MTRKRIRLQRRILWVILILVVMDHYYIDTKNKIRENIEISKRTEDSYVEECKAVLRYIPKNEWNDIYDLGRPHPRAPRTQTRPRCSR